MHRRRAWKAADLLTPRQAAEHLNVSSAHVLSLIERELLPVRKAGTPRRLAFEDLLRDDERQKTQRRAALDELARIDGELGL